MPAVLSCCSLFLRSRGRRGNEKLQRRRSPRERLCCCPGGAAGLAAPDASRVTQVGARPAAAGVATCPPTPRLPEAAGAGPEGGPAALAACPVGWAPRLLPELHAVRVRGCSGPSAPTGCLRPRLSPGVLSDPRRGRGGSALCRASAQGAFSVHWVPVDAASRSRLAGSPRPQ